MPQEPEIFFIRRSDTKEYLRQAVISEADVLFDWTLDIVRAEKYLDPQEALSLANELLRHPALKNKVLFDLQVYGLPKNDTQLHLVAFVRPQIAMRNN